MPCRHSALPRRSVGWCVQSSSKGTDIRQRQRQITSHPLLRERHQYTRCGDEGEDCVDEKRKKKGTLSRPRSFILRIHWLLLTPRE